MRLIRIVSILLPAVVLAACADSSAPDPAIQVSTVSYDDAGADRYVVRGRIQRIDLDRGIAHIDHEAIPGYMSAMTMPFAAADAGELRSVEAGDAVSFEYFVGPNGQWIRNLTQLPDAEVSVSPSKDAAPTYDEAAEGSIYVLPSRWTTHEGGAVQLNTFEGRPVVLSMVFTNCATACPLLVLDMKRIAKELPKEVASEVQYVLISLDPERDRPGQMQRFVAGFGLDDQWTILAADDRDVRSVANLLGVRYKQESGGQFAHTNMIAVLDQSGRVAHRQMGTQSDPGESIAALSMLTSTN